MASISKRKNADGSTGYRVRWRNNYGRQESHTCPDLTTARRVKAEVERAKAVGEDWQPPRSQDRSGVPTLTEVAQDYLNTRSRRLAATTIRNTTSILKLYLTHLASKTRADLTPDLLTTSSILELHDKLLAQGCTQGGTTKRIGILLVFWRWAEEHPEYGQWFSRPPSTLDLSPGAVDKRNRGSRPPTWEEADAFIAALNSEWYRRICTVQRYTGLRVSQAKRLRWSDLDADAHLLTIRPELGKSVQEKRGRVVPLSPHLVDEVAGWGVREDWLCGKDPATNHRSANFRRAWISTGADPRVYDRQPTHALRHLVVNGLRASGAPLDVVQYLVGHSRAVTSAVYTHDHTLVEAAREVVALIPKIGAGCDRCVPMATGTSGKII